MIDSWQSVSNLIPGTRELFSPKLLTLYSSLSDSKDGKLSKIFERIEPGGKPLMRGTEAIFFDDHGTMFSTTENGKLISITDIETDQEGKTTAKVTVVKDLGMGRPLSGKFLGDTLYVADAALGLTRVQNISDPRSKVEIVASFVEVDGEETRINFADDIAVAPSTGMVYFTDGKCSVNCTWLRYNMLLDLYQPYDFSACLN